MQPTKQEYIAELAKRELAIRSFLLYLKYVFKWFDDSAYQWNRKVHQQIIDALEKVENWQIKRLIINCPPRLWKSMLTSQYFASRFLGKNPSRKIIQASYWADLSNDFWRKTKQIVQSREFMNVFPLFSLAQDKREWWNRETSDWWWYYSVWVGWATTWKGADLLLIDDPVKDAIEASSEVTQKRIIEWYDSVASTRLQSQSSAIIVIMTRWNVNDLGGYILNNEQGREQVIIPWIDSDWNEIIRPWKRDEWHLTSIKEKMMPKTWEALYQQNPIAATDSIFKQIYFDYFLDSDFERADWVLKKHDVERWLFIDPAFSSSKASDDAVVLWIWQHKISKAMYWLDWYADTAAPSRTLDNMIVIYNRMKSFGCAPTFLSVESVSINKDQTQFVELVKAKLLEHWINIPVRIYSPRIKKEDRIKYNLESLMSQKGLKMSRNMADKRLVTRAESQFLDFPFSKHDDIIDCISQAAEQFRSKPTNPREGQTFYSSI